MKSYQDKKVTGVTAYKTLCRYNIFSQIHATTSYKNVEDTMSNDVFLAFIEILHYYAMIYTSYTFAKLSSCFVLLLFSTICKQQKQ